MAPGPECRATTCDKRSASSSFLGALKMKSSTKNCSKNKPISENVFDNLKLPRRMEPGLYFSKLGPIAVFAYETDKPQVVKAFGGNEKFDIKIRSLEVFDIFTFEFSNGLDYETFGLFEGLPHKTWPDISQRGPEFQMPYVVIWVEKTTNNFLKEQHGRLSNESTENLCALLERRMKELEEDLCEFETV
jgi:hypothetical protein